MEYDSAPVTEPIPLLYPYRASFRAMDQFIAAISSGLTDLELRQDDRNRHIIPKGFKGDLFIVGMDSTQFLRIDGRIAVGRMAGPHHRLVAYIDAVGLMEGRWKPPSATGVFTRRRSSWCSPRTPTPRMMRSRRSRRPSGVRPDGASRLTRTSRRRREL